jgi:molybdopterin molybdotransferase
MPGLLTIAEAQERARKAAGSLPAEDIAVEDALDRVLARDVVAASDIPAFPSSAMDGYAIHSGPRGRRLIITGESRAGSPFNAGVGDHEAVRISTGAAVPLRADAVIRQEDVESHGEAIETQCDVVAMANIRARGEDLRAGAAVLTRGTVLRAAELGAAVAAGLATLTVSQRPRASVLCTGDELRAPGEPLGPGQIHNSNAPMLTALTTRCGAIAQSATRLPDDPEATETALQDVMETSDVVIITGGVSVGPHDHVKPALTRLGVRERFWGVAMRPGKPTWFGTKGDTLIFGLPGNPVSAFVAFSLFVRPALAAMQGVTDERPLDQEAVLGEPVRQTPHREQALMTRLQRIDGATVAHPRPQQGSHMVSALLGASALALIPAGDGEVPAGTKVRLAELVR